MTHRYAVTIAAVAALVGLVGSCAESGSAPPADAPVETTAPSAETSAPPVETTMAPVETTVPRAVVVDWADPGVRAEFGDGWSIAKCEGDAPLLCADRDGATVGVVEALTYPIESFDVLDPTAEDSANLAAFAADFIQWVAADREVGCGPDYRLEPFTPVPFDLGGVPGISYGYTGTVSDGSPSELNLQYAAIRHGQVVLVTAIAYDEGGCPGRDDTSGFTSADLTQFRPHLERVLADSPLPDLGG